MENQANIGDRNTQGVDQNPINQPLPIPATLKVNYFVIFGAILICSVLSAFGGYYFGKQPTSALPINQLKYYYFNLSGWSYKSDACGVRFPIPPKEKPYYQEGSGESWNFFSPSSSYPVLLSKLLANNREYIEGTHKQAETVYGAEGKASGYIGETTVSEAVAVSCFNNFGKVDNQGMLSLLSSSVEEYNQQDHLDLLSRITGSEVPKYIVESTKEVERWGRKVVDVVVNGDKYTMFASPQYIYEIKIFSATADIDNFVKETAQKIFDNLLFE